MKFILLLSVSLLTTTAFAKSACQNNIEAFIAKKAPHSREILVTGHYTKKSTDGSYKKCALSITTDGTNLVPDFSNESFNPRFGDGAAFWPFGTYTMEQPVSNEYRTILGYSCKAGEDGFSIDLYFKMQSGWHEKKRYILSVLPVGNGTYDVTLGDGEPSIQPVTCRGVISEK